MRVTAAHEHAVFFHEAKARGSFAGAGESVGVAGGADEGQKARRSAAGDEV